MQGGARELLGAMHWREATRTIPVVGEQQSPVPAPVVVVSDVLSMNFCTV